MTKLPVLLFILSVVSCTTSPSDDICGNTDVLKSYTDPDGNRYQISTDGSIYNQEDCSFVATLFVPGFENEKYATEGDKIYIVDEGGARYEVFRSFQENMDNHNDWKNLFIQDLNDRTRFITNLTLQGPGAKTASAYLALRDCLIEQSCDFVDNNISLMADPTDPLNTVLQLHAYPPTPDMVVSKSSITSNVLYFAEGEDIWFSADYYIEKGMPHTIVDFESSHVLHWGPRAFIRNGYLEIENKFLDKQTFPQNVTSSIKVPMQRWFNLKVHFQFDEEEGIIQVWQDDELIINHLGPNIPVSNWILDALEVGISATSEETILFVDNIQLDTSEF